MSCFLNVIKSFTGDCTNSNVGVINVEIFGSAPDYTIQWITPASLGTIALGAGVTGYTETGLSGGTYTFNVIDTCSPSSTIFPVSVYISTGTCVSITSTQDTTCNFENGSLTASTQNVYNGNAEFYLYHNTLGYITSGESFTNTYFFDGLSEGTYYVIANDGGGCTGKSETCIVKPSTEMDFGFFVVNNAGCTGNTGKLYITGLTGNPPYTYLWQDNSTNDFITNLPSGNYSVQVTDSSGCVITKSVNVLDVPQIGVVSFTSVNPDCFVNNGSVTVYTSGGTLPFYYSGSNGYTIVTYDTEFTFNNLGSGLFSVLITDAALCAANGTTSLMMPQGFSIVDIGVQNSTCNNFSGALNPINIFGPSQPYTYTLTYPDGVTTDSVTVNSTNWSFDGLSSGTYTLSILGGTCVFTNDYTIDNTVLYDFIVTPIGTTNNGSNGSVTLQTNGGVGPFIYTITTKQPIISSNNSVTFNNLPTGSYTATVLDTSSNCTQSLPFMIDSSQPVTFSLVGNDTTNGPNGSIQSYITSGVPPFTYLWSNGETTSNISGLNAGKYSLTITDSNGTVSQRDIPINGYDLISSTQSYTICDDNFVDGGNIKKGIKQMYVEGYFDSISDDYNCVLDSATFVAQITMGDDITSFPFYFSNSLTDYPSDNQWWDTVESILEGYPNIGNVIIDYVGNTITINTNCDPESLFNINVKVRLRIEYLISCEKCDILCDIEYTQIPTPTPTKTPTQTPVPASPTPTNTVTPTITPTNTVTPTPTNPCPNCVQGTVEIGTQIWDKCNLNVTTYRNGDLIPQVTGTTAWAGLTTGAWRYFNNDPANEAVYGKLYNWYAVNDPRGLAPNGSHIPTETEYTDLITFLGGTSLAGGKLKEQGFCHWFPPNTDATNSSGWAGLPGSEIVDSGTNGAPLGTYGIWWTSTADGAGNARNLFLKQDNGNALFFTQEKVKGFSVRCLQD